MNKRLLSSHGLPHLEASIWAVGRADSGRPRGTSSPSPHTPRTVCAARRTCQALASPPAPDNEALVPGRGSPRSRPRRPGTSPHFT